MEGRKGQSYVEGVTVCLSSQERGILGREEWEGWLRDKRRLWRPFDLRGVRIPATLLAIIEKDLEYREIGLS